MSVGLQAAQSCHALRQYVSEHPESELQWFKKSNYLVLLNVANEKSLSELILKASDKNIKYSIFREPDMNNEITSVAFEPGQKSKKLCSNLRLLGN